MWTFLLALLAFGVVYTLAFDVIREVAEAIGIAIDKLREASTGKRRGLTTPPKRSERDTPFP